MSATTAPRLYVGIRDQAHRAAVVRDYLAVPAEYRALAAEEATTAELCTIVDALGESLFAPECAPVTVELSRR